MMITYQGCLLAYLVNYYLYGKLFTIFKAPAIKQDNIITLWFAYKLSVDSSSHQALQMWELWRLSHSADPFVISVL